SGLADNLAKATPGSGGLVSGVSAEATTRTQSRSRALVGDRAVLTAAGSARFEAAQENRDNTQIDAGSYGVIAGAGASAYNDVDSAARVEFGTGSRITAQMVDASARNRLVKSDLGDNVKGEAAGLFAGATVTSRTDLDLDTVVLV